MPILKRLQTKELFFPVTQTPLRAVIDGRATDAPAYMSLHHGFNFLGIKPKGEHADRVFCPEHEQVYLCGAATARAIDPDLTRHLSFASENLSQAFILFGREGEQDFEKVTDKESKRIENHTSANLADYHYESQLHRPLSKKERHFQELLDNFQVQLDKLKKAGFRPTVVAENGFDYLHRTVFYVLVELSLSPTTKGYLTLARYKFPQKTMREMVKYPGRALDIALENLNEDCVPKFIKALSVFGERYDKLSEIQANTNTLTAVTLDIFDRNRNLQTLSSDEEYLKKLREFITDAAVFYRNSKNMSALLFFIIRMQIIDFSKKTVSLTDFRAILTEKNAYKNLKRIYAGKNKEAAEREKYIEAQVTAMRKIMEI